MPRATNRKFWNFLEYPFTDSENQRFSPSNFSTKSSVNSNIKGNKKMKPNEIIKSIEKEVLNSDEKGGDEWQHHSREDVRELVKQAIRKTAKQMEKSFIEMIDRLQDRIARDYPNYPEFNKNNPRWKILEELKQEVEDE